MVMATSLMPSFRLKTILVSMIRIAVLLVEVASILLVLHGLILMLCTEHLIGSSALCVLNLYLPVIERHRLVHLRNSGISFLRL